MATDAAQNDVQLRVAKRVLNSAKRFQKSVQRGNFLDAFTSKKVEQLQASVDEFVEIFDVSTPAPPQPVVHHQVEIPEPAATGLVDFSQTRLDVEPAATELPDVSLDIGPDVNEHAGVSPDGQDANADVLVPQVVEAADVEPAVNEHAGVSPDGQDANADVLVPQVVEAVVEAANVVLNGVKTGDRDLVTNGAYSVALHTKKILYVVQVVAAQAAAKDVKQVASEWPDSLDVEKVAGLPSAMKKVLDVLQDVPAISKDTTPHVEATSAKADVSKAADGFKNLVLRTSEDVVIVKGKQVLLHAVNKLGVATNKAQLYANVETAIPLSLKILDAARECKGLVEREGLGAACTGLGLGVSRLQSATNDLLFGLNFPAAATELTYDTVDILKTLGQIESDAERFVHGVVKSGEDFRVLVGSIRTATNRVLSGVKVPGAAKEAQDAAKKFRDLAIEVPRVANPNCQVEAIEDIRRAVDKVPGPEPKVSLAAKQVLLAAEEFHDWARGIKNFDRVEVRNKLTEVQKELQNAFKCVDEDCDEYKEAMNLSLIKLEFVIDGKVSRPKYPLHKAALEDWEHKQKDLSYKVSKRQAMSNNLTNQIFNIIGWYAVFLGVVLTAVSQLTQTQSNTSTLPGSQVHPLCKKIWFPFVLTLFGMVVTIAGIWHKYIAIKSLEVTIHRERRAQAEFERRIGTLRRKGPERFSFATDVKESSDTKLKGFVWGIIFVVVALLALTVLFVLSYYVILCNKWPA